jgi:SAM-dependent methyltransferase
MGIMTELDTQSHNFLQKPRIHTEWESDYLNPDMDAFYDLVFADILKHLPSGPNRLLDAGCGYCYHTVRLAQNGAKITAVDFSTAALDAARTTIAKAGISNNVDLRQADLTALPFESCAFDSVVSWGVLMHIPQLEAAVRELVRVLKPGGILVLGENNIHSLDVSIRERAVDLIKHCIGRKSGERQFTERGSETWIEGEGGGLMVRKTDMNFLSGFLTSLGMIEFDRTAGQFSEMYTNMPSRALKRMVYSLNKFYFSKRLPARFSMGNILYFRKAA